MNKQMPKFSLYTHPWYCYFAEISRFLWSVMIAGMLAICVAAYFFIERMDVVGCMVAVLGYVPIVTLLYGNLKKQWENSLPMYLDVSFEFEGCKRLHIVAIPLLNKADMRAQAQTSINIFINDQVKQRFPLKPMIKEGSERKVFVDTKGLINKGRPLLKYYVKIELTEDVFALAPEVCNSGYFKPQVCKMIDQLQGQAGYLHSHYPFDLNHNLYLCQDVGAGVTD